MEPAVDLLVAAQCEHPLRAIVGGGTVEHWRSVYAQVVNELTKNLESPRRGWLWPNDWFAHSNDSYYDCYGQHRNAWCQFDAVIAQLQRRTRIVVHEYCDDRCDLLNTAQGIQQWRQLMKPFVTDLQCILCGNLYQMRVTVFSHDPGAPEYECDQCIETVAAYHHQMYDDYFDTLCPRSRMIEEATEQGRQRRLQKRRRIPGLSQSRRRQRIC